MNIFQRSHIVLDIKEENLSKFIRVAKKLDLRPKVPVALDDFADANKREDWKTNKNMLVFSLFDPQNPLFLLDIFIETPFNFDKVYKERKNIALEDTFIPVVPITHLISMKEASDRPQDRADIFYLKKIIEE